MAGPGEAEVDLPPGRLLAWLEGELGRARPCVSARATRDWRIEPATAGEEAGIDPEDGLAAHVAYGTLEIVPPDRAWELALEVIDAINGGMAEDWPPVGIESDGSDEVSLATFAETFALDEVESRVVLRAASAGGRQEGERLIARILAEGPGNAKPGP